MSKEDAAHTRLTGIAVEKQKRKKEEKKKLHRSHILLRRNHASALYVIRLLFIFFPKIYGTVSPFVFVVFVRLRLQHGNNILPRVHRSSSNSSVLSAHTHKNIPKIIYLYQQEVFYSASGDWSVE